MCFEASKNAVVNDPKLKFKATTIGKALKSLEAHPLVLDSGKAAQELAGIGKGLGDEIDAWLKAGHFPKMLALQELMGQSEDPAAREQREADAEKTGNLAFVI